MESYISIDIETTGLDLVKSKVLQIAAVYDDGKTPLFNLPFLNIFIDNGDFIDYAELGALAMHEKTRIFSKIAKAKKDNATRSIQSALYDLLEFIRKHKSHKNIVIAGKNVGTFDIPLLKNKMDNSGKREWDQLVHYAVLDVGSLYFSDFGRIASLSDVLKNIGANRIEVTHDALDDALDVVRAVRHKISVNTESKTLLRPKSVFDL